MILDLFTSLDDFGDILHVRVTPKAAANRIKIEHLENGKKRIRVYVTVAPEDGKANKEVIRLLSKELGIPCSAFIIIRGLKTRDKIIQIKKL